jgi:hypothetical protein
LCSYSAYAPIHFFRATGDFFFLVPAGVKEFGVKVAGASLGERVKASLWDPNGKRVEQRDNIAQPHLFVVAREDNVQGEVWKLRVERPSEGVLEDFFVELLGIPPLVAHSPDSLLKPIQ